MMCRVIVPRVVLGRRGYFNAAQHEREMPVVRREHDACGN